MTKHKHAELIKAWADGAEIEAFDEFKQEWFPLDSPLWSNLINYRIKPTPIIEKRYMHIDRLMNAYKGANNCSQYFEQRLWDNDHDMNEHLELTFTDGKLTKVEVKEATNGGNHATN